MREIKFRGKRIDNGKWAYGFPLQIDALENKWVIVSECQYEYENGELFDVSIYYYEVFPETVGQYTGLKDKNGVEIYEGDIIDIHQTVNGCNLFEIVWDKTRWNAKYAVEMVIPRLYEYNFNNLLDVDDDETEIEIVGNVYDGVGKYD